ncbi:hypothetical protein GCM10009730_23710 [Streptomyces albidochromogenes]
MSARWAVSAAATRRLGSATRTCGYPGSGSEGTRTTGYGSPLSDADPAPVPEPDQDPGQDVADAVGPAPGPEALCAAPAAAGAMTSGS